MAKSVKKVKKAKTPLDRLYDLAVDLENVSDAILGALYDLDADAAADRDGAR